MLNERAKLILSLIPEIRSECIENGSWFDDEYLITEASKLADVLLIKIVKDDLYDWNPKDLQKGEIETLKFYANKSKFKEEVEGDNTSYYTPLLEDYTPLLEVRGFVHSLHRATGEKYIDIDEYGNETRRDEMENVNVISPEGKKYITDHPELFGEEAA